MYLVFKAIDLLQNFEKQSMKMNVYYRYLSETRCFTLLLLLLIFIFSPFFLLLLLGEGTGAFNCTCYAQFTYQIKEEQLGGVYCLSLWFIFSFVFDYFYVISDAGSSSCNSQTDLWLLSTLLINCSALFILTILLASQDHSLSLSNHQCSPLY